MIAAHAVWGVAAGVLVASLTDDEEGDDGRAQR
jgi:hypothetical protein